MSRTYFKHKISKKWMLRTVGTTDPVKFWNPNNKKKRRLISMFCNELRRDPSLYDEIRKPKFKSGGYF